MPSKDPLRMIVFICGCLAAWWGTALADVQSTDAAGLRLVQAVMCEFIEEYEPRHIAIVFSINAGRVSCYTSFDNVPEVTQVEHRWLRREELITTKRLTLNPPSWATYSSIQLRKADKGPWRVEIWQVDGPLLNTIRFSVSD